MADAATNHPNGRKATFRLKIKMYLVCLWHFLSAFKMKGRKNEKVCRI
jgi:hypothetical protein